MHSYWSLSHKPGRCPRVPKWAVSVQHSPCERRHRRNLSVSNGSSAVHPHGHPISHSRWFGWTTQPWAARYAITLAWAPRLYRRRPVFDNPQPRRAIDAVGVGHNPEPITVMGGARVASPEDAPPRIIPQRGQVAEDDTEAPGNEGWTVFHEHVIGSNLANDASEVCPEPGALPADAAASPRGADVLAREPAADDVNRAAPRPAVERLDVIPDRERFEHAVPLPGEEDTPCIGSNLNSADGAPAKEGASQDAAARSRK